jgi:cysteine desulfuration protein SufE
MTEFSTQISSDDIIETLSFFDDWEDRYKYIIDLGRELAPLDASQRTEEHLVRGCQSQVWLLSQQRDNRLFFDADSDALISSSISSN